MNDIAEFVIRRILVALDASTHSLAALEEAAALAAALQAELLGLFVEDINLVRSAGLPFTRQVSYPSGEEERLSSERIDRELKARAELLRKALAAAAGRSHTRWSFRIVRGQVTGEILAAASQMDLVLLGKSGWSPARRVGTTALSLIAASPGAFLLVPQEAPQAGPIAVLYEGSDGGSRRALEASIRLAIAHQAELLVLISCTTVEACNAFEKDVHKILAGRVKKVRIRRLYARVARDLDQALRMEGARLLVLPGASGLAHESELRSLLEITHSPLLLIR